MKVLHTSDVHGRYKWLLEQLARDDYDVWVDTGDMLPNPGWSSPIGRMPQIQRGKQRAWWSHKQLTRRCLDALNGRPVFRVLGNHDFFDWAAPLRRQASNIHLLDFDRRDPVEYGGLTWYGISEIPYMNGNWNFETHPRALAVMLDSIPKCDVLLSHAPPSGVLSYRDEWGIVGLENLAFRYMLFGHIHETGGFSVTTQGKLFYNSATTSTLVEIE